MFAAFGAARRDLERLRAFYAPLGLGELSLATPADGIVVGELRAVGTVPRAFSHERGTLVWGEPLPDGLDPLAAGDTELRRIDGMTAVIAWHDARVRAIGNAGGPATLYRAGDAVATHAVAAAILAGLDVAVDAGAIPEFVALDFVGGERTLIAGVRALPAATVVTIERGEARERSWWPAAERWRRVPEREAYTHTADALLATLHNRASKATVGLALTGGLDSGVGAAALDEIGVTPLAFTWATRAGRTRAPPRSRRRSWASGTSCSACASSPTTSASPSSTARRAGATA